MLSLVYARYLLAYIGIQLASLNELPQRPRVTFKIDVVKRGKLMPPKLLKQVGFAHLPRTVHNKRLAHYVKESGRFASISWVKPGLLPFLLGYSATVLKCLWWPNRRGAPPPGRLLRPLFYGKQDPKHKGIRRYSVLVAYPYLNLVLTCATCPTVAFARIHTDREVVSLARIELECVLVAYIYYGNRTFMPQIMPVISNVSHAPESNGNSTMVNQPKGQIPRRAWYYRNVVHVGLTVA